MDVERIQKINNLALDLLKQGLATNKDDAIAQAEKIFHKKSDVSLTGGDMQDNSLQAKPAESQSEATSQDTSQVELSKDKIEEILEKNTKFLVAKIREFQEKIDSLEKSVAALKRELVKQREENGNKQQAAPSPASSVPIVSADSGKPVQSASSVNDSLKGGPATEKNPRSGEYKDTDVSIEKFFYAGTK